MRVLITGGLGFIGRALTKELKAHGHFVASYDLKTYDLKEQNAATPDDVFRGSIMDFDQLDFSISSQPFDVVVHAACVLGVARTEESPVETLDVILQGTRNICVACANGKTQYGSIRIVYLSTSEVYGDPAHGVRSHEEHPVEPRTPYAAAKLCGEHYVKAYRGPWSIVRPFNVYGASQRSAFVVKNMMENALAGKPIRVYGDGKQIRSFCYIDDFSRGLARVVEGRADGHTVNLGRPDPVSMVEMARAVLAITDSDSRIKMVSYDDSDRMASREIGYRCPDIRWAKKHLQQDGVRWSPDIPLGEGLRRMMEEMRG